MSKSTWKQLTYRGNIPVRCEHVAVVWDRFMFVFGGETAQGQNCTRFDKLDLETLQWTQIRKPNNPPKCRGHTAVVFRDSMFIFGGYHDHNATKYNDLYEYSFIENKWTKLNCTGTIPTKRNNHSAVVYKDEMYVFAGHDSVTGHLNDMYAVNLKQHHWRVVKHSGQIPSKRCDHVAVLYKDSMFVHAGYNGFVKLDDLYEYNFSTQKWTLVQPLFGGTSKVDSHRAVVYGDSMYVFGGADTDYLNKFFEFHFQNRRWTELDNRDCPSARNYHSMVVWKNFLYVFGGYTEEWLNTLYVYDFGVPPPTRLNELLKKQAFIDIVFEDSVHKRRCSFGDEGPEMKKFKIDALKTQGTKWVI